MVSYDAGNGYNFSESTSLSECLLVAKRAGEHSEAEETKFVISLTKPKTSIEAIALADRIPKEDSYLEAREAKAFVLKVTRQNMLAYIDNWGKFVFLPHL